MMQANNEDDAALEWQASRRKPDGHFAYPVDGFGTEELPITLWLASPIIKTRYVFIDGVATKQIVDKAFTPELLEMRAELYESLRRKSRGWISCLDTLYTYTAKLISLSYNVTDEDLALLMSGEAWKVPMIRHIMEGDDATKTLAEFAFPEPPPEPPPTPPTPVAAEKKRKRLWLPAWLQK